jgi:hypothetical protein
MDGVKYEMWNFGLNKVIWKCVKNTKYRIHVIDDIDQIEVFMNESVFPPETENQCWLNECVGKK